MRFAAFSQVKPLVSFKYNTGRKAVHKKLWKLVAQLEKAVIMFLPVSTYYIACLISF